MQTINRDTKSKGRIVGLSLNKWAVQRWLQISHAYEWAAIIYACHEKAGLSMSNGEGVIKGKEKGRMSADKNYVWKKQSTRSNWVNAFLLWWALPHCFRNDGLEESGRRPVYLLYIRKRLMTKEFFFFHDPLLKLKQATFDSMPFHL